MDNINRLIIFLILIGLIYIYYRYQNKDIKPSYNKKKASMKMVKRKQNDQDSDVSLSGLSQISIDSIDDYKQDSVLNSMASGDSLAFLEESY